MPEYTVNEWMGAIAAADRRGDAVAAKSLRDRAAADMSRPETQRAAGRMATEGMGFGEKLLTNLGAGFDTVGEGLRQIVPGMRGPSDTELRESRGRKQALADSTDLGLFESDYVPSLGRATQFAGETLPTLPVGGLLGRGALAATRGVLPNATQALARSRVAAGAGGGALGGAMQPVTSDESRGMNTLIGGTIGAALPGAVAAARAARGYLTQGGGTGRAPEVLRRALGGDDAAADVARGADARTAMRAGQTPEVRAIPETLAEATGSSAAARTEARLGRNEAVQDEWTDFTRRKNEARYSAVEEATRDAPFVEGRALARDAATTPMREGALQTAGQVPTFAAPIAQALQTVMAHPSSVNPSVQRVVELVARNLDQSPAHLYEVRKLLTDRLNGPHRVGDELSAAVKGADRQTMTIIRAIDDALDTASNGQWRNYLDNYSARSRRVDAASAARNAQAPFLQDGVQQIGAAPEVTANRVRQSMRAAQSNFDPQQSALSQPGQRIMGELDEQMAHAAEPQRARKLTGTSGGGSQTSMDVDSALARIAMGDGRVGRVLSALTRGPTTAMNMELTRLMQNPTEAANAIRAALAARQPLSAAQQVFWMSQGSAMGVGADHAMSR